MRSAYAPALGALLLLGANFACSGDGDTDASVPDKRDGGGTRDGGENISGRDGGFIDGGEDPDRDGGPRDGGTTRDGGMPLAPALMPGQFVQVAEGRVEIGVDTLATLETKLGAGTRSAAANTRSYEWMLSDDVMLTVWFANNDLGPVQTVSRDATVLWVSVMGGFTGTTPGGTGLSTMRAAVETDLGAAPHEVALTQPSGTLLQYFTTGALIAVDDTGAVRTITITRAYQVAPDGEIDPNSSRVRLSNGDLEGFMGLGNRGTNISTVRQRLGEPDAEGDITVSGQELHTLSYAFIGIEVFQVDNAVLGADRVAFINVHAPYYGTGTGMAGIGSSRVDFENFLSGQGYGNGSASSTANFFCYTHSSAEGVGVTYSTDTPPAVTSLTIPLLQCP